MGSFEYVMVLVSIVIGLGVTHILTALGSAVHRLRGHGPPIRLEATYLLWVGFVLIWLISFWWFEFKFQSIDIEWTFGLYVFVIFYAILLFLMAVVLVPYRMEGVTDSYEYFMAGRPWFFGALFLTNAVDVVDTFLKGADWGLRPIFLTQVAIWVLACVVGVLSERRSVQLGTAATVFTLQLVYAFQELGILGSW